MSYKTISSLHSILNFKEAPMVGSSIGVLLNNSGLNTAIVGNIITSDLGINFTPKTFNNTSDCGFIICLNAVSFPSDSTSTINIGLRQITSTGLLDNVWLIKKQIPPGTLIASSNNFIDMSNAVYDGEFDGTILPNVRYALCIEMTTRVGTTDAITVRRFQQTNNPGAKYMAPSLTSGTITFITYLPYTTSQSNSKTGHSYPLISMVFTDKTLGYIYNGGFFVTPSFQSHTISTTNSEYGIKFKVKNKEKINTINSIFNYTSTATTPKIILYKNPTSNPTIIHEHDILSPNLTAAPVANNHYNFFLNPSITLEPSIEYGLVFKRTASNITIPIVNESSFTSNNIPYPSSFLEMENISRSNPIDNFTSNPTGPIPYFGLETEDLRKESFF